MKTGRAGLRGAVDHAVQGKKLRDRAEECRTLARMMTSEDNAAYYLRLAETYDRLAEQEEQLARDIEKFNINGQDTPRRIIADEDA